MLIHYVGHEKWLLAASVSLGYKALQTSQKVTFRNWLATSQPQTHSSNLQAMEAYVKAPEHANFLL